MRMMVVCIPQGARINGLVVRYLGCSRICLTHPQLLTNHQTSNTAMDLERKYKPELKVQPSVDQLILVQ